MTAADGLPQIAPRVWGDSANARRNQQVVKRMSAAERQTGLTAVELTAVQRALKAAALERMRGAA